MELLDFLLLRVYLEESPKSGFYPSLSLSDLPDSTMREFQWQKPKFVFETQLPSQESFPWNYQNHHVNSGFHRTAQIMVAASRKPSNQPCLRFTRFRGGHHQLVWATTAKHLLQDFTIARPHSEESAFEPILQDLLTGKLQTHTVTKGMAVTSSFWSLLITHIWIMVSSLFIDLW